MVYHSPAFPHCVWASQQPKLFCGEDNRGKADVLSIAVDSGDVARLGSFPGRGDDIVTPSSDDKALYLNPDEGVMRWEIATQDETVIAKILGNISQDERWLIRLNPDALKQIDLRPLTGGDWRPLLSTESFLLHFGFTPDGNWFFYTDVNSAGRSSLFRIATAGGAPERLGDLPAGSGWSSLQISSDEQTVIFAVEESPTGTEMWSLENFEPVTPKGAK